MIILDSRRLSTSPSWTGACELSVEMGHSPIVLNVAIRGSVKHIFVVLDTVVKPSDLLFEVAHLAGLVGLALYDG